MGAAGIDDRALMRQRRGALPFYKVVEQFLIKLFFISSFAAARFRCSSASTAVRSGTRLAACSDRSGFASYHSGASPFLGHVLRCTGRNDGC